MSTVTTDDRRAAPADPPAGPFADLIARARRILEYGPKDDDYLPIPDQAREAVDRHVAWHLADGFVVSPTVRLRMIIDQALHDRYGGDIVSTLRTDRGVVVLAVGIDEVSFITDAIPPAERSGVVPEHP